MFAAETDHFRQHRVAAVVVKTAQIADGSRQRRTEHAARANQTTGGLEIGAVANRFPQLLDVQFQLHADSP